MNNYQYLIRFVKQYNLFRIKAVQNRLKILDGFKENLPYTTLFNFINSIGCWVLTKEGRLFWEIQHYNLLKFFFETHPNKDEAKQIIKSEGGNCLHLGYFEDIKNQPNLTVLSAEIEQFTNTIYS